MVRFKLDKPDYNYITLKKGFCSISDALGKLHLYGEVNKKEP